MKIHARHFALALIAGAITAAITIGSPAALAAPLDIPAPIAETFKLLKSLPDEDSKKRVASFELLVEKLEALKLPSADEALAKSDLVGTEALKKILQHSRGVISVSDLSSLAAPNGFAAGFSLGLSARDGIYEMLSERFDLIQWSAAYPYFEIDWHKVKNHTEVFLTRVQETEQPIVFFVPGKTLSYSGPSVTVDELKWLLADTKRLKNAYFVFGIYDVITPDLKEAHEGAGISNDQFRTLFMRALGASSSSYEQNM